MLDAKKVSESRIELTQVMMPEHTNPAGNVQWRIYIKTG